MMHNQLYLNQDNVCTYILTRLQRAGAQFKQQRCIRTARAVAQLLQRYTSLRFATSTRDGALVGDKTQYHWQA